MSDMPPSACIWEIASPKACRMVEEREDKCRSRMPIALMPQRRDSIDRSSLADRAGGREQALVQSRLQLKTTNRDVRAELVVGGGCGP